MTADLAAGWILPVDKPEGPTSHDVVAAARRALGIRRIGHTGTLDPFASGLLLLCIGPATRLAEFLDTLRKSYAARMRLGATTDTDDRTGTITSTSDAWMDLDRARVEAAVGRQVGILDQVPPTYSARKVDGERLYRAARRGAPLTASARRIEVHSAQVKQMLLPDVDLEITCSTGTYVRAIARDIGVDLQCGAHLVALRRTAIGSIRVDRACTLDELAEPDRVAQHRVEVEQALAHVPSLAVSPEEAEALRHGRPIGAPAGSGTGTVAVLLEDRLIAMAEIEAGSVRPRKVFAT